MAVLGRDRAQPPNHTARYIAPHLVILDCRIGDSEQLGKGGLCEAESFPQFPHFFPHFVHFGT